MFERYKKWFSYTRYFIINKDISLNRIDCIRKEYTELLDQFPELTRPTVNGETVKHGITHKIVTKGHPVFVRPRRLTSDMLVTAKCEFDEIIKLGVIKRQPFIWYLKKRRLNLERPNGTG